MKENILKIKSFDFALRMVHLHKYMQTGKLEFITNKQLMRSGVSVGAVIGEADFAENKVDFIHKMAVAQKETNKSIYRLELLDASDYLTNQQFENINTDAVEITQPITAVIKTTKLNIKHYVFT